jgi:hypothetical protein
MPEHYRSTINSMTRATLALQDLQQRHAQDLRNMQQRHSEEVDVLQGLQSSRAKPTRKKVYVCSLPNLLLGAADDSNSICRDCQSSGLLRLPPELRSRIYAFTLAGHAMSTESWDGRILFSRYDLDKLEFWNERSEQVRHYAMCVISCEPRPSFCPSSTVPP